MKPLEEISALVQGLSTSEKRYLKLRLKPNTHYAKLYEKILAGKLSEKKSLKKDKKLRSALQVLKGQIGQALAEFDEKKSVDGQLAKLIRLLDAYYTRGLMAQCQRCIKKIKEIATKHQKYEYLLLAVGFEIKINPVVQPVDQQAQEFHKLIEEHQEIMRHQQELTNLMHIEARVRQAIFDRYHNRESAVLKLENSEALQTRPDMGIRSQFAFYKAKALYAFYQNDKATCRHFAHLLYQLAQSQPEFRLSYAEEFYFVYYDLLRFSFWYEDLGLTRNCLRAVAELVEDPKVRRNDRYTIFLEALVYITKFNLYWAEERYGECLEIVEPLSSFLEKQEQHLEDNYKYVSFYNIFITLFMLKEFNEAKRWASKLLNGPRKRVRSDLVDFTDLLLAMILYEERSFDVCASKVEALKRKYQTKPNKYLVETLMVDCLTQCLEADEITAITQKTQARIKNEVLVRPLEKEALKYFRFAQWLQRLG